MLPQRNTMTILEQTKRLELTYKVSTILLLISIIAGFSTGGTLWVIPIGLLYLSTSMTSADISRLKKKIIKNFGTSEEEHY